MSLTSKSTDTNNVINDSIIDIQAATAEQKVSRKTGDISVMFGMSALQDGL